MTPLAARILAHLRTCESARIADLRKLTGQDTQAVKAAALELCRAGLATSEWSGMRFRLRVPARTGAQA